MKTLRECSNCGTRTALDICPACDLVLTGNNKGKERWDINTKKPKKK